MLAMMKRKKGKLRRKRHDERQRNVYKVLL